MDCHAALAMTMPPGVIARSEATLQSRKSRVMDCRAALAMTKRDGLPRCARNDETGRLHPAMSVTVCGTTRRAGAALEADGDRNGPRVLIKTGELS